MLPLTDAFAMLGINLVLSAGVLALFTTLRVADMPLIWAKLLTVLCFVLLWIPLGTASIPLAAYVRGITSDLSITFIALAVWSMGRRALGWPTNPTHEQVAVMAAVAVSALFLYPMSLGLGDWDAYRPGWGSWGMLLALLALCVVCWVKGLRVLPALVALALLAWSMGLMESTNLWDYLLDPWLSIFALGFVFIKCMQVAFNRLH